MFRTLLAAVCIAMLAVAATGEEGRAPAEAASPPNLVIVMADQWRASALGFLGQEPVKTPHMPYDQVPQRYVERYAGQSPEELITMKSVDLKNEVWGRYAQENIKNYFAMVTGVDEQFGRILDALDEGGLSENTIVLFTSDHGNCLGAHGEISKGGYQECSMKVPFLLRYPGVVEPRRDSLLLSTPDIYPTLLDLMGRASAVPEEVEGRSWAQIFRTGQGERSTSQPYYRSPAGRPADGVRGIRTHRYTLALDPHSEEPLQLDYMLFDHNEESYHLQNLTSEKPEVVQELVGELRHWLEATGDPWKYHLRAR